MSQETEVYCETCGEEIPPRRLQIVPTAKNCVECIKSGRAEEEVFAYRGKFQVDEEGNIHTDIVTSKKDWEQVQKAEKLLKNLE